MWSSDYAVDKFIRNAIYGGRVYVKKPFFEAKNFSRYQAAIREKDFVLAMEIFEEIHTTGDYVDCVDVTSLYPTAMAIFDYPSGEPTWLCQEDMARAGEAAKQ